MVFSTNSAKTYPIIIIIKKKMVFSTNSAKTPNNNNNNNNNHLDTGLTSYKKLTQMEHKSKCKMQNYKTFRE